jgi:hypothetical protein
VLIVGDELGELGGLAGSDSLLMGGSAQTVSVASVGIEPARVPAAVVALGGGAPALTALLPIRLRGALAESFRLSILTRRGR